MNNRRLWYCPECKSFSEYKDWKENNWEDNDAAWISWLKCPKCGEYIDKDDVSPAYTCTICNAIWTYSRDAYIDLIGFVCPVCINKYGKENQ